MKTSYLTKQLTLAQRTLDHDTKQLLEAQRTVKSCTLELEELDRFIALAKMPGVVADLKYDRTETREDLRNAKDEVKSYSNDVQVDRTIINDIKRDLAAVAVGRRNQRVGEFRSTRVTGKKVGTK